MRLRQLLHNLVKNSLESLSGEGWVCLRTCGFNESGRDWVELTVVDNGPGIAETVAENLFDPYVTTKTTGSGLGLAVVQKIVDEHGGSIHVDTESGGGARFRVRLPASVASVTAESVQRIGQREVLS